MPRKLLPLLCIPVALLMAMAMSGCVKGIVGGKVKFAAAGEELPVKFEIGTKNTPGEYQIVGQELIGVDAGEFEIKKTSAEVCGNPFMVEKSVLKDCTPTVKAKGNAIAHAELKTVWKEVGFLEKTSFTELER
ncbi:MAG: hypothetical protein ABW065_02745 [Solirubrobacterales bacterium]